jgi:hypothetical protein
VLVALLDGGHLVGAKDSLNAALPDSLKTLFVESPRTDSAARVRIMHPTPGQQINRTHHAHLPVLFKIALPHDVGPARYRIDITHMNTSYHVRTEDIDPNDPPEKFISLTTEPMQEGESYFVSVRVLNATGDLLAQDDLQFVIASTEQISIEERRHFRETWHLKLHAWKKQSWMVRAPACSVAHTVRICSDRWHTGCRACRYLSTVATSSRTSPSHICTWTGPTPVNATSARGRRSPFPHLRRDFARSDGTPTPGSAPRCLRYQEILLALKPRLLVEFGTCHGGSALFFAGVLQQASTRSTLRVPSVRAVPAIADVG